MTTKHFEQQLTDQKKDLFGILDRLQTDFHNFTCEVRMGKVTCENVHTAANLKQKLVLATEEIEDTKKELFIKVQKSLNNVLRKYTNLHTLGNEYLLNDGIIDEVEENKLLKTLNALRKTENTYEKNVKEFASFCKKF